MLIIQCHFVRFYWKRDISKKAKILRKVTFPINLDMRTFCSSDLKEILDKGKQEEHPTSPSGDTHQGCCTLSLRRPTNFESEGSYDTTNSEINGSTSVYRLKGVVTHQGTSADSGHYCSYVRSGQSSTWLLFNDDKVQEVPEETIATLAGGGTFSILSLSVAFSWKYR